MDYQDIQSSFFTMGFSPSNAASIASSWLVRINVNREKPATISSVARYVYML